jgi:hypothetical protein
MADVDRLSGKASYWTFNGVTIPITKSDLTYNRDMGKTTDSNDYSISQDMLCHTQIPVAYQVEGSIEFRYRFSSTPGLILTAVTSLTQIPMVIGLNNSFVQGHGVVDLFNLKISSPVEDIITGTADVKSWGNWVPNA